MSENQESFSLVSELGPIKSMVSDLEISEEETLNEEKRLVLMGSVDVLLLSLDQLSPQVSQIDLKINELNERRSKEIEDLTGVFRGRIRISLKAMLEHVLKTVRCLHYILSESSESCNPGSFMMIVSDIRKLFGILRGFSSSVDDQLKEWEFMKRVTREDFRRKIIEELPPGDFSDREE